MLAEIITIGDEILIGQIVDTNSAFIAQQLNSIGVSVFQITSVQDDKAHLLKAFREAEANADIVIITGGLGPTKDDITKHTIAEYCQDTLVSNPDVLQHIEQLFATYISTPISDINRQQALLPTKAIALHNAYGTAPGMWIEKDDTIFVSLPGVPYEMKALITNAVLPRITQQFKLPYILHKTVLTYGLGESAIANRIEAWEDALPDFIKLAYLPNLGRVRLRLSAKGQDKNEIETAVAQQLALLLPQIEDIFVGFEDSEQSMQHIVANLLTEHKLSLAIAESCTGGKLSESLTANSGASSYFKGSIVSYATASKTDVLGISQEIIDAHSVVSTEVAQAMAKAVQLQFNSDYAIATTGNAGPTKGDSDADVGTVIIAIATPDQVFSETFNLGNHRTKVINKAVNKALELLQKEILKNY